RPDSLPGPRGAAEGLLPACARASSPRGLERGLTGKPRNPPGLAYGPRPRAEAAQEAGLPSVAPRALFSRLRPPASARLPTPGHKGNSSATGSGGGRSNDHRRAQSPRGSSAGSQPMGTELDTQKADVDDPGQDQIQLGMLEGFKRQLPDPDPQET